MAGVEQTYGWAGLQGTPSSRRSSRSRRCSQGHSALQTHSPSAEPWVREATKWLREDFATGWSRSMKCCSWLRGRSRPRWCQSPSPECWSQSLKIWSSKWVTVSPYVRQSCRLGPRSPGVGCSEVKPPFWLWKPKKQVRFNLNEELSSEPALPTGMTLFSSGGEAFEWYTIPTPTAGPVDTPWLDHEEDPQWNSTPTGGIRLKVQSSTLWYPSRPEGPDPVSYPCRWIQEEMLKIPNIHWWKTMMLSGKGTMFSHILNESLGEPKALPLAHWKAVAFQLPWVQQEVAG